MEITLDQLLASREERASFQKELLKSYPGMTLVCLTVIMPGKIKRNLQSLVVAQAAVTAMVAAFGDSIQKLVLRDRQTGYEAYLETTLSNEEAKLKACNIEDTHPLGRLFDLDVIDIDGIPVSRETIGQGPRKCLICDNEARYCMRNRTHTLNELSAKIDEMIEAYVR